MDCNNRIMLFDQVKTEMKKMQPGLGVSEYFDIQKKQFRAVPGGDNFP